MEFYSVVNSNFATNSQEQDVQMTIYERTVENIEDIFIGIDVHKRSWQVTVMLDDQFPWLWVTMKTKNISRIGDLKYN